MTNKQLTIVIILQLIFNFIILFFVHTVTDRQADLWESQVSFDERVWERIK